MRQTLKYIAFFDFQYSDVRRNYVTSAANKLEYIAKSIAATGKVVEILSVSQIIEEKFRIYKGENRQVSDGVIAKIPFSWGGRGFLVRFLRIVWHLTYLFLYLTFRCNDKDTVVVYHSLGYYDVIWLAKKLRHFKLILEVEEIYTDVRPMHGFWRKIEFRMLNIADSYIFPTKLLNDSINHKMKPYIVVHGTYQAEPHYMDKFNDGLIHIVYAGTFDPFKGGANVALSAARFLSPEYHIHICGFGSNQDIAEIKQSIEHINSLNCARISYDGLKKGQDFISFLQQCHIGLSTQNPGGKFNNTSFPSKILTYLANGLSVVTIRIPVVESSSIGNLVTYFNESSGEALARAISTAKIVDYRQKIVELDSVFKSQLCSFIV